MPYLLICFEAVILPWIISKHNVMETLQQHVRIDLMWYIALHMEGCFRHIEASMFQIMMLLNVSNEDPLRENAVTTLHHQIVILIIPISYIPQAWIMKLSAAIRYTMFNYCTPTAVKYTLIRGSVMTHKLMKASRSELNAKLFDW